MTERDLECVGGILCDATSVTSHKMTDEARESALCCGASLRPQQLASPRCLSAVKPRDIQFLDERLPALVVTNANMADSQKKIKHFNFCFTLAGDMRK